MLWLKLGLRIHTIYNSVRLMSERVLRMLRLAELYLKTQPFFFIREASCKSTKIETKISIFLPGDFLEISLHHSALRINGLETDEPSQILVWRLVSLANQSSRNSDYPLTSSLHCPITVYIGTSCLSPTKLKPARSFQNQPTDHHLPSIPNLI